jgi:hypothetical protein
MHQDVTMMSGKACYIGKAKEYFLANSWSHGFFLAKMSEYMKYP